MRESKQQTATIPINTAVTEAIQLAGYAAGIIIMPAEWTTADLGLKVCGSSGGTFATLKDRANGFDTDVSIDVATAGAAYPIPPYVFAAPYIQLFSHNGSGVAVNQAAARTFKVFLKD